MLLSPLLRLVQDSVGAWTPSGERDGLTLGGAERFDQLIKMFLFHGISPHFRQF